MDKKPKAEGKATKISAKSALITTIFNPKHIDRSGSNRNIT